MTHPKFEIINRAMLEVIAEARGDALAVFGWISATNCSWEEPSSSTL